MSDALRLAEKLDFMLGWEVCAEAAAELRRLHAEHTELGQALKRAVERNNELEALTAELEALNAELVEALQSVVEVWFRPNGINYVDFKPYMEAARAALAKCEASK